MSAAAVVTTNIGGVSLPNDAMDGLVNALRLMDLDVILPTETIVTTLTTPITSLLQTLSKYNILNVPVVSPTTQEFIGFIGMNELVEFVTSIVPQPTTWAYNADTKDINLTAWNTATVKTVLDSVTKRDGYAITCPKVVVCAGGAASAVGKPVATGLHPTGLNVFQVFELMASRNLRRVAILQPNENGSGSGSGSHVRGIVTQSMITRLLSDLVDKMGGVVSYQSIGLMKSVVAHTGHVQTVGYSEPAITAFLTMFKANVQGLAVTNDDGKLVDVISIRDLRGLLKPPQKKTPALPAAATATAGSGGSTVTADASTEDMHLIRLLQLWRPVSDFLDQAHSGSVNSLKEPVFGSRELLPTDNLKTALLILAEDRIHRLFICKSLYAPVPVSVITQTDIIAFILSLCASYSPSYTRYKSLYAHSAKPAVVDSASAKK